MRRFAVFALLAALVVGVAPSFWADETGDKWAEHKGILNFTLGYEEGVKLAQFSGKPMMLFFTTTL